LKRFSVSWKKGIELLIVRQFEVQVVVVGSLNGTSWLWFYTRDK
jgi:hypothetical protein